MTEEELRKDIMKVTHCTPEELEEMLPMIQRILSIKPSEKKETEQ